MIYFSAEYGDTEKLLALGAERDDRRQKWYVRKRGDYKKFARWIGGKMITGEIYIAEKRIICPFCGKPAALAALATGGYSEDFLPEFYGAEELNFLYGFEKISGPLAGELTKRYPVRMRYNRVYGYRCLSNGCGRCDRIFPDEYVFGEEEDSPFNFDGAKSVGNLRLLRIKLSADIALDARVARACDKKLFESCPVQTVEIDGL